MRSLKEISVGNGWYWLAGAAIAFLAMWAYVAVVSPIVPVLAWHRTHSRKMHFAEFSLDVPLLWYVPKADFHQPDDVSIDRAIFLGHGSSSISLIGPPNRDRFGVKDPEDMWPRQNENWVKEEHLWAKVFGASNTTRTTYAVGSGSMDCLYEANPSSTFISLSCFNRKTGSSLYFTGPKQDYLQLHDIVH